jgi:hypothetical protein
MKMHKFYFEIKCSSNQKIFSMNFYKIANLINYRHYYEK